MKLHQSGGHSQIFEIVPVPEWTIRKWIRKVFRWRICKEIRVIVFSDFLFEWKCGILTLSSMLVLSGNGRSYALSLFIDRLLICSVSAILEHYTNSSTKGMIQMYYLWRKSKFSMNHENVLLSEQCDSRRFWLIINSVGRIWRKQKYLMAALTSWSWRVSQSGHIH